MKRVIIRSTIFNLAFYIANIVFSLILLPVLLFPRKYYLFGIHFYNFVLTMLEYAILGLKYEIRGKEHLPSQGTFIVAAKHMSAYETFKLRALLNDPAIILKKELLKIPIWGAHLKKTDVIAIDRATPKKALLSLEQGALRIKEQGRPIVIYPQGTRVHPHETTAEKPYKSGIYRIQKATGLPIIPLATNSGLFWPPSGWFKSPGTVIFQFSPPIQSGGEKLELMKDLENTLEANSLSLMNEAKMNALDKKKRWPWLIVAIVALAGLYSYAWFESAKTVKAAYMNYVSDLARTSFINEPVISGFPGPIALDVLQETIETDSLIINIKILHASGLPVPFMPIKIKTGPISIISKQWNAPIHFQGLEASLSIKDNVVRLLDSTIKQEEFEARITGDIDLKQRPVPKIDVLLSLKNYSTFLQSLASNNVIKPRIAMFIGAGFSSLADPDGIVRVPLIQRKNKLYAGPLPIADLPDLFVQEQAESLDELLPLEPYNQLGPAQ